MQVALDLHMAISGAAEVHPKDIHDAAAALRIVLSSWHPSVLSPAFDDSVKAVLVAAVAEYDEAMKSDPWWKL
jgi:hypothetical protein